jgi:hypothetical protein
MQFQTQETNLESMKGRIKRTKNIESTNYFKLKMEVVLLITQLDRMILNPHN